MWFSRSYRGAIESNIACTAAAASCSPVVPAGCAPRVLHGHLLQLQPAWMALSSSSSVRSFTTLACPMSCRSTKWRMPPIRFLSPAAALSRRRGVRRGSGGRPNASIAVRTRLGLRVGQTAHAADLHRYTHAPAHGLTVQQSSIVSEGFDGMSDCVAEIEDHTQTGLPLVLAIQHRP